MGKRALLVGCNYPGTESELHGCITDVSRMLRCLVDLMGFEEDDITILVDTDDRFDLPTGANIRQALDQLVSCAQPGDSLFFLYSGHGTRLPTDDPDDETGFDECIVPCDFNFIYDQDLKEMMARLPEGCIMTMVSDSCHSGGLLENAKEQVGNSAKENHLYPDDANDEDEDAEPVEVYSGVRYFMTKVDSRVRYFMTKVDSGVRSFMTKSSRRSFHHRHGSPILHRSELNYEGSGSDGTRYKSRELPLSTIIKVLRRKRGNSPVHKGNIRQSLFHIFGEDTSPNIKSFIGSLIGKRRRRLAKKEMAEDEAEESATEEQEQEEIEEAAAEEEEAEGNEENEEDYTEEEGEWGRRLLPDNGVLISGCQTYQTSADVSNPEGEAYGALTNAIVTVLEETGGEVGNRELIIRVREMLEEGGYTQQPGLYCSDEHADVSFIIGA